MSKVFDPSKYIPQNEPTLTISGNPYLHFNTVSCNYIKPPIRVNVAFDPDKHILYFFKDQNGLVKMENINKSNNGRIYSVALSKWLDKLGIAHGKYFGKMVQNGLAFHVNLAEGG